MEDATSTWNSHLHDPSLFSLLNVCCVECLSECFLLHFWALQVFLMPLCLQSWHSCVKTELKVLLLIMFSKNYCTFFQCHCYQMFQALYSYHLILMCNVFCFFMYNISIKLNSNIFNIWWCGFAQELHHLYFVFRFYFRCNMFQPHYGHCACLRSSTWIFS